MPLQSDIAGDHCLFPRTDLYTKQTIGDPRSAQQGGQSATLRYEQPFRNVSSCCISPVRTFAVRSFKMENSASPPKDPWYFPPIDRPREPPPPIDPAGHYLHWEGVDTEPWYATHTSQEAIQQMQAEQARQAEVHPGQTVPAERTEAEQTGAIQVYYPHPYQRQLRPTEMQEQQYMPQEYVYASTSQIPHTAYPPSQGQVPAMQHGLPSPTSSGEFPYSAHTPAMCTHVCTCQAVLTPGRAVYCSQTPECQLVRCSSAYWRLFNYKRMYVLFSHRVLMLNRPLDAVYHPMHASWRSKYSKYPCPAQLGP